MNNTINFFLIVLTITIASCKFSCNMGNEKEPTKTVVKSGGANDNAALSGAIIKNDIEIEATNVKLKEAYLVDEEGSPLIKNETKIGKKIYLMIEMDTGWTKINGKSFIGASERISTSAGRVVIDAEDIFKENEVEGFPASKTKTLNLSAIITQADPGLEDFTVNFRVWDKRANAEVKGKYKFRALP